MEVRRNSGIFIFQKTWVFTHRTSASNKTCKISQIRYKNDKCRYKPNLAPCGGSEKIVCIKQVCINCCWPLVVGQPKDIVSYQTKSVKSLKSDTKNGKCTYKPILAPSVGSEVIIGIKQVCINCCWPLVVGQPKDIVSFQKTQIGKD